MVNLLFVAIPLLPLQGPASGGAGPFQPHVPAAITVTILFDNFSADDRLATGWGFAALVETPEHTILFDTGADGQILLENMRLMEKDPMAIEAVVISHAHGDHTGGLEALLGLGLHPRLYLLSAFPSQLGEGLAASADTVLAAPGQEIVPGVRTTGQVGTAIPEQALLLDAQEGSVVITGCAHPGVVRMVERAQDLGAADLYLVMGGFHLTQAPAGDIQEVVTQFRRLGVARAGPTHCSGETAMDIFREAYGEAYQPLGVGRVLTFAPRDQR